MIDSNNTLYLSHRLCVTISNPFTGTFSFRVTIIFAIGSHGRDFSISSYRNFRWRTVGLDFTFIARELKFNSGSV